MQISSRVAEARICTRSRMRACENYITARALRSLHLYVH